MAKYNDYSVDPRNWSNSKLFQVIRNALINGKAGNQSLSAIDELQRRVERRMGK